MESKESMDELSGKILSAAIEVHRKLGPGLLESAYSQVLFFVLSKRGLSVQKEVPLSIVYDELVIKDAYRIDLLVENKIIVEVKSVQAVSDVHKKQLLTYLRLSDKRLGLLLNFNEVVLRQGISRVANNL